MSMKKFLCIDNSIYIGLKVFSGDGIWKMHNEITDKWLLLTYVHMLVNAFSLMSWQFPSFIFFRIINLAKLTIYNKRNVLVNKAWKLKARRI